MHPRLLRTFLAVARNRSFTRAAEEVHLAQSSVSDQMQILEAELGAELFVRSRQGLDLTQAGNALVSYAEEILLLADEARVAIAATGGSEKGTVTIGALETIASARLPKWLADFQATHSDIGFRLKIAGTGELMRKLEAGELDVVFCFDGGGLDERFVKRAVAREALVLVAPKGGAFDARQPDLAELATIDFLATEVGCVYRALFDRAFADAGLAPPRLAAEAGSIGAIARLVAAGAGVGLVPRLGVADAIDRGEINELRWPGPSQTVPLVMIWRRRRVQPPPLKLLLAAASEGFAPVKSTDARPRHAVQFQS
ncbi:LysR family transcriptional regulator [Rhizobium sp. BR 314]|uniref:LysR family transcriptional regulator n=1 Tax=Rhizobium sp. BR 314 TaxID=3040013 RepID=UPI0039BEF501